MSRFVGTSQMRVRSRCFFDCTFTPPPPLPPLFRPIPTFFLSQKAEARGLSFGELISMPELGSWHYPGGSKGGSSQGATNRRAHAHTHKHKRTHIHTAHLFETCGQDLLWSAAPSCVGFIRPEASCPQVATAQIFDSMTGLLLLLLYNFCAIVLACLSVYVFVGLMHIRVLLIHRSCSLY
jgi:hypothetical protein